jgi:glyoxylase-like metal-dependent hydrolase (beta-lactamase superfamily II)
MYRRWLLQGGAACACAPLLGVFGWPRTSVAANRPVRAVPVADGVYMVEGEAALGSSANRNFISNAGFVVTDAGVVVVDALGSPALAQELIAEVARITPQRITHVVVTHFHADHIYGLQVFKQMGAQILAHPSANEYLHSDTARLRLQQSRVDFFPWVDETTQLTPATQWLTEVQSHLRVGSRTLRIRHVGPAHTAEDLVVFDDTSGVLFAGDLVYRGRIPFVGQADSRQWIDSLAHLLAFAPKTIVPGHGPVSQTPREDLTLTRDYLRHLRHVMGAAARDLEPFEEAYAKADWSQYEHMPLFKVANRINAYNTYLLLEQQGMK